jgi:hypothetical protein
MIARRHFGKGEFFALLAATIVPPASHSRRRNLIGASYTSQR